MLRSALQQGILSIKCIKQLLKTRQIPPSVFTVGCAVTDDILGLRCVCVCVCVCVCEWGGDTVCGRGCWTRCGLMRGYSVNPAMGGPCLVDW